MDVSPIEKLIENKIGLEGSRINSHHIAKVTIERMTALQQPDLNAYIQYLQNSPREFEALIESAIVPETWFFRDREAFNFMKLYVKYTWLLSQAGKVLRVLSVPCSTGEEPYSIAIALLESGLTPNQFQIDAIDISKVALEKARAYTYSENSFRGEDLEFRSRYFKRQNRQYKLYDWIAKNVNFSWGNLLDPLFLVDRQTYHIIWCRNLLIYFNRTSQKKAFQALDRLLLPEGFLFLGYAEFGTIESDRFVSVRHPRAFAYRKVATSNSKSNFNKSDRLTRKDSSQFLASRSFLPSSSSPLQLPSHTPQSSISPTDLQSARRLADEGKLEEAKLQCDAYVQQHRTSSEGYLLLGEIEQALGRHDTAEANLRKAVYLNPNCYEALVHLAQLQEQRGDDRNAAIIRQRIQRLLETS